MASKNKAYSQNPRNDLSADFVRKILSYDPATGNLHWKGRDDVHENWNARYCGRRADISIHNTGYRKTGVNGYSYHSHRIAWLIFYGEWPKKFIDHINGNKTDNRIKNLRDTDTIGNQRNVPKRSTNTSGFKGVHWCQPKGKSGAWVARINIGKKRIYLGVFDTPEKAHEAYCNAAIKWHGEFANFG